MANVHRALQSTPARAAHTRRSMKCNPATSRRRCMHYSPRNKAQAHKGLQHITCTKHTQHTPGQTSKHLVCRDPMHAYICCSQCHQAQPALRELCNDSTQDVKAHTRWSRNKAKGRTTCNYRGAETLRPSHQCEGPECTCCLDTCCLHSTVATRGLHSCMHRTRHHKRCMWRWPCRLHV